MKKICPIPSAGAVLEYAENNLVHHQLDLDGTGVMADIALPFRYLPREPGVRYDLIVEGGYKVYDLAKSKVHLSRRPVVAIIGPLDPCIGIAITDGKKLLLFHKHVLNSVTNMLEIIQKNLDLSCPEHLLARIFATADVIADTGELPANDVARIKAALADLLKIHCEGIIAEVFPLYVQEGASVRYRYPEGALGNYLDADLHIAVKLDDLFETQNRVKTVRFFSISPCEVNFFNLAPDLAPEARQAAYKQLHDAHVEDFYKRVVGMSPAKLWEQANESPFFSVPFKEIK